jgi:amino acid adenylation domain-containing protein
MTKALQILPALLEHALERYADRAAIVMESRALLYAELAAAANRIANSLLRHEIVRGDRILLWTNRSPEATAAIWGILKAGAAYVPVDYAAPAPRVAAIARDCEVAGIVTTGDRSAKIESAFSGAMPTRGIWMLDAAGDRVGDCPVANWPEIERERADAPAIAIDGEDLASIQYTSGSTGTPKGVMIPHRALFAQAQWTAKRFSFTPDDRTAAFMPVHSPMASFDTFAAAAGAATSIMIPPRIAAFPAAITQTFSEQRVTVWYIVPTLLIMMLNRGNLRALDWSALRMIAYGGETLPLKQLRELMEIFPGRKFVHVYSRTEVKIRSYHEVRYPPDELDTRQIGEVAPEFRMMVLDRERRPVAPGAAGELWIAGPGMTLGYWKQPELNAETMRTVELGPGDKVFAVRTGDLVRGHAPGGLELIGRVDSQVKVRGFRVEIGEVEAALQRHPGVDRAVVLAEADDEIGRRLLAIVVAKKAGGADERTLREHCIATLPRYMVPDVFEFRAELPINSNGKVDRQALISRAEATGASRKS